MHKMNANVSIHAYHKPNTREMQQHTKMTQYESPNCHMYICSVLSVSLTPKNTHPDRIGLRDGGVSNAPIRASDTPVTYMECKAKITNFVSMKRT